MSKLKFLIQELRASGKNYAEIQASTGASKGTISYYCGKDQKEKSKERLRSWRKNHSLNNKMLVFKKKKNTNTKIRDFQRRDGSKNASKGTYTFTTQDVINKFGNNPICYLTGEQIDLMQPSSYSLDHFIPATRGGGNELENLKICTSRANKIKSDLLFEELVEICKKILVHNGYQVSRQVQ